MEDLIKGELDWHNKVNENFHEVDSQMADIAINVESFFIVGMTDYTTAIQNAINYIKNNAQYGTILFSGKTYSISAQIIYYSNIKFKGKFGKTFIKSNTDLDSAFVNPFDPTDGEDVENIIFKDIGFLGGVSEDGTFPRIRSSRTVLAGIHKGILAQSSLDPYHSDYKKVTNIKIESCIFLNLADLPLYLDGVYGETVVQFNKSSNNADIGTLYCESVRCIHNNVEKSSDNGISLSRGCLKVVCIGNKVKDCAYDGIWLSGYTSEGQEGIAPNTFVCTDNEIKNCGYTGISLNDAPANGIVANNIIDTITLGTYDNPQDYKGTGIKVSSYPSNVYTIASITNYTQNLNIHDNIIKNAKRGGIETRGCNTAKIHDNIMIDIGTEYMVDGATAIPNDSRDYNFGIRLYISNSNIDVHDNKIIDTTAQQLIKYPLLCENDASNVTNYCKFKNNEAYGCKNSINDGLIQDDGKTNQMENDIQVFQDGNKSSTISADAPTYKRMGLMKRSDKSPSLVIGSNTSFAIEKSSTANIDDAGATYDTICYATPSGKIYSTGGLVVSNSNWDNPPIQIGAYYLWIDSAEKLRIKNGLPTSDTDGNYFNIT